MGGKSEGKAIFGDINSALVNTKSRRSANASGNTSTSMSVPRNVQAQERGDGHGDEKGLREGERKIKRASDFAHAFPEIKGGEGAAKKGRIDPGAVDLFQGRSCRQGRREG